MPKTLYYYASTARGPREQVQRVVSPQGHTLATYYYEVSTQNILSIYDGLNNSEQYTYNDKGRIATVTDAQNRVTTYTYNDNQLDVAGIGNALGTIEFEYNANRDLTLIRDRREETATTGDDPTGLGVRQTAMTYNTHGQLISITDPADIVTRFTYNGADRLSTILRDDQQVASFVYDAIGRVTDTTGATGLCLNYAYDNLNRITRIIYPDSRYVAYAYSGGVRDVGLVGTSINI